MYKLNMLCSCVSRDVFGIKDEDAEWEINKSDKYEVHQYANFISPLYSGKPGYEIDEKAFAEAMNEYRESHPAEFSNFRWRCKYIDITHSCMDFLIKENPDYLVIDSYAAAYNYWKLEDGTVITDMDANIISYLADKKIIPPGGIRFEFKDIPSKDLDEMVSQFASNLKKEFKPEQIILIEIRAADLYLQNGNVYSFPQSEELNKNFERYFNVLCKYFSDCNIVKTNTIMLGNSAHKWGTFPVHFVNEIYFDYYLKKIDMIVGGEPELEHKMAELDESFSRMMGEKYFSVFYHALRNRELSALKRLFDSEYSRLRTAHGTYVFYDEEHNKIVHRKSAGFRYYPICAIHEGGRVMMHIVAYSKVFYLKNISKEAEIELSSKPIYWDVSVNFHGLISFCFESKFLSARKGGEFGWMKWNREWEEFALEKY